MKKLPYDKTVVMELKVQLADLLSRTVALRSSVAAPIPMTQPFNSGDVVITDTTPYAVSGINSCLILSSFEDFDIVLGQPGHEVVLSCKGLYVHNGQAGNVLVRSPVGVSAVRVQYIWS